MGIRIKGLEKLSTIDYPGKTCCIVFLAGCNFRCPYCHNPDLIECPDRLDDIKEEELFGLLEERRKWIDGICITGGEPCLDEELPGFIGRIKERGFLVKLDTNGTNPGMLGELIRKGMIDYVAMDIKAPPEKYSKVVRAAVDMDNIRKSMDIIMKSGIKYEFRTTVVPRIFNKEDMESIGKWLEGAERYFIQQFRPGNTLDMSFSNEPAFSGKELEELAGVARKHFMEVGVRE
jgi:pyruvate formate lyase activating enzyme